MSSVLHPTPLSVQIDHKEFSQKSHVRAPMHAIFLETGSNDAYTMTLVSVTDDPIAGQSWVDKMNGIYQSLQQKRQNLILATLAWRELHPMPPLVPPVLLEVPTPPVDRPATPEEREEKHRVNNENFVRQLMSRDPQRQWSRQEAAFSKEWLAGNLTEEEAQLNTTVTESFWSIQPVPWHNA